jgi:hypothetical protein
MMKRKLLLLVGILLILSLACSTLSFGGNDESAEDPNTDVTMKLEAEDDEAVQDEPSTGDVEDGDDVEDTDDLDAELTYDSDGLDQLDSYRATISYELKKDDGTEESFKLEQAATREPAAQHLTMSSEDGDIEYIQIEDQMWIRFGEEWIQGSADAADIDDDGFGSMLSSSDDWISDVDEGDYEYLGKETVNGIETKHYRVEYSEGWMGMLDQADADGDIDNGVADVWIANERDLPEFIVRYRVELEGTLDGEEGTVTLAQDVTEVNEDVQIEAPEGVAMGGLPEGIPVYPDATDLTNFGGMTTFTAPDDVKAVNDFYTDALTNAGWEEGGDGFDMENMVSSTWSKGSEELSLTITGDDDDVVTVLIVVMDNE